MAHMFTRDEGHTCQCGQPQCSQVHEPPLPHVLAGYTQAMLSQSLLVTCVCGATAEYDPVWGCMRVPSRMWARVEREMQDVGSLSEAS